MSHDKIKAAARRRMAETGEPYATARRAVIREQQHGGSGLPRPGSQWFAISFSRSVSGRITTLFDTFAGSGGPGKSGVEISSGEIRVRMGGAKFDIPRGSVRSAHHSQEKLRGTTGVHMHKRGQLLVNGSADGLVRLSIDPPFFTPRTLSTMFVRERVTSLLVSLADPDGFIAAIGGDRYA